MKYALAFLLSISASLLLAQPFSGADPAPPFENVLEGAVAFIDVDGDEDLDLILTGEDAELDRLSILYINDGNGGFTPAQNNDFEGVWNSSIAIADVDGDEDEDVILAGADTDLNIITDLYLNDGDGNFTRVQNTPFAGVALGDIAFADVDDDDDLDVIVSGAISESTNQTSLYLNDGEGVFTLAANTPFKNVRDCSIVFGDIDDDDDQDVLIMGDLGGTNDEYQPTTDLYLNNGSGVFSPDLTNTFEDLGVGGGDIADVDGDNDLDYLLIGLDFDGDVPAFIYLNDGDGNFTETTSSELSKFGISDGTVDFVDMNLDDHPDIFITGEDNDFEIITVLLLNDGNGSFTEETGLPFEQIWSGAVDFGDIDGDLDPDVLITGENTNVDPVSRLYVNDIVITSLREPGEVLSSVELFPNPVREEVVYLRLEEINNPQIQVSIFDPQGRLLTRQQARGLGSGSTFSVDVSGLEAGVFFLRLEYDGKPIAYSKLIRL